MDHNPEGTKYVGKYFYTSHKDFPMLFEISKWHSGDTKVYQYDSPMPR